jgi:hypothetical protein
MSERLRTMTDEELGAALATLDLAWPDTPELAPTVMASTRAAVRPRLARLPLSRSKRIMLIAAASMLLLAGAALAAKLVIDLGAVVVEVTPPPGTQPTSTPGSAAPFGEPLSREEAAALLGDDLALPARLGPPDRVWADELITDAGEVVRITVAWDPGPRLPAIEGTTHGAVLMRFEGDTDQAFKEVYEDTGVVEPVRVDGIDGIWTRGPHVLRLLTSDGVVFQRVDGNVLLWRDGPYTMRLETALPKADALRIAASAGTP